MLYLESNHTLFGEKLNFIWKFSSGNTRKYSHGNDMKEGDQMFNRVSYDNKQCMSKRYINSILSHDAVNHVGLLDVALRRCARSSL